VAEKKIIIDGASRSPAGRRDPNVASQAAASSISRRDCAGVAGRAG
jgi:hypothetical protein